MKPIVIEFTQAQYERVIELLENGSPFMEGLAANMREQAEKQPPETASRLTEKINTVYSILSGWNKSGQYTNILEYLKPTP